jgi:uracil-DNA glycosylase family 4
VAPPWGGAYFREETKRDAVREGLFAALHKAIGVEIETCEQFLNNHFFLTPSVKCPSSRSNRDRQPSRLAVKNCAGFLLEELLAAEPERILALGRVPFKSLCGIFKIDACQKVAEFRKHTWRVELGARRVPLSGTYFPGNNRHKGFSAIVQDIAKILEPFPKVR